MLVQPIATVIDLPRLWGSRERIVRDNRPARTPMPAAIATWEESLAGADSSLVLAQPPFIIVGGLEVDQPENSAHVEPAQLISLDRNGELDATSDVRADGSFIVVGRDHK